MHTTRLWDRITLLMAAVLILSLSIALPFLPHKEFSERENRALTPFPSISAKTLWNGDFFSRLADFCSDHFPLRSYWVALRSATERILGKQENNGILFGREGYLIPRGEYDDLSLAQRNLRACRVFLDGQTCPATVCLVPRACDVLTEHLPRNYDPSRSLRIYAEINAMLPQRVDLTPSLTQAAKETAVYYRTDHHWTTHGAYLAYLALAPSLGITPYPQDAFSVETVSENFLGTSYSTSGLLDATADTVMLFRYEGDDALSVWRADTQETTYGLYRMEYLSQKDQYRVFLGGNYGYLRIGNETESEKPRLLLIKDSFANAMIPFLSRHFALDVLDLRYYEGSTARLLAENDYDRILILCGTDTVATNPFLEKLAY